MEPGLLGSLLLNIKTIDDIDCASIMAVSMAVSMVWSWHQAALLLVLLLQLQGIPALADRAPTTAQLAYQQREASSPAAAHTHGPS